MSRSKILFFVTGSIAGFKAAQVVSLLVKAGHEVQCVASASALKFVGAATFEGLTGKRVVHDIWEDGHAMDHIHLSRWADFGVVCPASANTLAKMALGLSDEIVSATLLAWPARKPVVVFPAMNSAMLSAEPTQKHLAALRSRGVHVAETGSGPLACGEEGVGRLLEPDEIIENLNAILKNLRPTPPTPRPKILITGGATREAIDGIRFISNVSTGRTAAELCDAFSDFGWEVTYLHGAQALVPKRADHSLAFEDYASLNHSLRQALSGEDFRAIIHCAAVSDYTIASVDGHGPDTNVKLQSGGDLFITLKPTAKLLPNLKEYSWNKNIRVIGFKLTLNADNDAQEAAAHAVLTENVDAVVVNDWAEVSRDRTIHPGYLLTRTGGTAFATTREMADLIHDFLRKDIL